MQIEDLYEQAFGSYESVKVDYRNGTMTFETLLYFEEVEIDRDLLEWCRKKGMRIIER